MKRKKEQLHIIILRLYSVLDYLYVAGREKRRENLYNDQT